MNTALLSLMRLHHSKGEFGARRFDELYRLIWLLNRSHTVMTSHTTAGSETLPFQGFEWAKASVGIALDVIYRAEATRFDIESHRYFVRQFMNMLTSSAHLIEKCATRGWFVGLSPEIISFDTAEGERLGYGAEVRMIGFAGTRTRAAARLSRILGFVSDALAASVKRAESDRPPA